MVDSGAVSELVISDHNPTPRRLAHLQCFQSSQRFASDDNQIGDCRWIQNSVLGKRDFCSVFTVQFPVMLTVLGIIGALGNRRIRKIEQKGGLPNGQGDENSDGCRVGSRYIRRGDGVARLRVRQR